MDEPLPHLVTFKAAILQDIGDISLRNIFSEKELRVWHTQLPIAPAFAMTAHKSQGLTLSHVIIDLEGCRGTEPPYVMLSCVQLLDGVLILHPFAFKEITCRPSKEFRKEEHHLHVLNILMIIEHDSGHIRAATMKELQQIQGSNVLPRLTMSNLNVRSPAGRTITEQLQCELDEFENMFSPRTADPASSQQVSRKKHVLKKRPLTSPAARLSAKSKIP